MFPYILSIREGKISDDLKMGNAAHTFTCRRINDR